MFLVNRMLSYVLYIKDHWTSCYMARILSKSTVWEHFPNNLAKWKLCKQDNHLSFSFHQMKFLVIMERGIKCQSWNLQPALPRWDPQLVAISLKRWKRKSRPCIGDRSLSMRCSSRSFHSRLTRWSMIGLIDLSGCILIEPSPSALKWPSPSGDHLSKWQGKHRERHWDEH